MLYYLDIHDCKSIRPSMIKEQREVPTSSGWWIFKTEGTRTLTIYEQRSAHWTCPECDAEWSYHLADKYDGDWARQPRWLFLTRPERWVEE